MPVSIYVVSAASGEPVTLTEAKSHLREDGDEQNTLIESLITSARQLFEDQSGRRLMPQVLRQYFDGFPCENGTMRLSIVPVRSVSSVNYLDSDGDTITLDASGYRADVVSEPARIDPAYGESWPANRGVINDVWVDVAAGYADAASVPKKHKQAILLLVGHWYENREATAAFEQKEVPFAARVLIDSATVYTQ